LRLAFFIKMESVREVKTMRSNWLNLGAWLLLAGCLSAFLFYGLSFFLSKPTVETITVDPSASVINDNSVRDVKYQQKTKKTQSQK